MQDLSIIIPAYNEEKYLPRTLDSVKRVVDHLQRTRHLETQVIVVDNNSTDRTAEIARSAGVRVVFEAHNQIARARNTGAKAAGGECLIFLDADTHLPVALAAAAVDALSRDAVIGGGATVDMDRALNRIERMALESWNWISRTFRLAAGSFLFCRKSDFETIGGFDESLYASEEIKLSRLLKRRGRRRGKRFLILQDARVVTSARKFDLHGTAGNVRMFLRFLWLPWKKLRSRDACAFWYDGKR